MIVKKSEIWKAGLIFSVFSLIFLTGCGYAPISSFAEEIYVTSYVFHDISDNSPLIINPASSEYSSNNISGALIGYRGLHSGAEFRVLTPEVSLNDLDGAFPRSVALTNQTFYVYGVNEAPESYSNSFGVERVSFNSYYPQTSMFNGFGFDDTYLDAQREIFKRIDFEEGKNKVVSYNRTFRPASVSVENGEIFVEDKLLFSDDSYIELDTESFYCDAGNCGEGVIVEYGIIKAKLDRPTYSIYEGGNLVKHANLTSGSFDTWDEKKLDYDYVLGEDYVVSLDIPTHFPINRENKVISEFSTAGSDVSPPKLTDFNMVDNFGSGERLDVDLKVEDSSVIDVEASYRVSNYSNKDPWGDGMVVHYGFDNAQVLRQSVYEDHSGHNINGRCGGFVNNCPYTGYEPVFGDHSIRFYGYDLPPGWAFYVDSYSRLGVGGIPYIDITADPDRIFNQKGAGPPLADNLAQGDFSASVWVKPDSVETFVNRSTIFGKRGLASPAPKAGWRVGFTAGRGLEAKTYGENGNVLASSVSVDNVVPLNEWRHVTVSYSDSDKLMRIYVNGVEVQYQSQVAGSARPGDDESGVLLLGGEIASLQAYPTSLGGVGYQEIYGRHYVGLMDEFTLWRRALTGVEIEDLYLNNGENLRKGDFEIEEGTWESFESVVSGSSCGGGSAGSGCTASFSGETGPLRGDFVEVNISLEDQSGNKQSYYMSPVSNLRRHLTINDFEVISEVPQGLSVSEQLYLGVAQDEFGRYYPVGEVRLFVNGEYVKRDPARQQLILSLNTNQRMDHAKTFTKGINDPRPSDENRYVDRLGGFELYRGPSSLYQGIDMANANISLILGGYGAYPLAEYVIQGSAQLEVECLDNDGDGYNGTVGLGCGVLDCNDFDSGVNPGKSEICGDGLDNDCSGEADCADGSCSEEESCQIAGGMCDSVSGLVGYWPLDGTAEDLKAGNDGIVTGAEVISGKIGEGYLFNGSGESIVTEEDAGISGSQARTLAFWAKADAAENVGTGVQQYLAGLGVSNDIPGSRFSALTKNSDWFYWFLGSTSDDLETGVPVEVGEWQFHVLTYDGSQSKWYINGNEIASKNNNLNTPQGPLEMGRTIHDYPGRPGGPVALEFLGSIDEVSLWNRVLSVSEISELYSSGDGKVVCSDEIVEGCTDSDGDGYNDTFISGLECGVPDCAVNDASRYLARQVYIDNDGDEYTPLNLQVGVCANETALPANYSESVLGFDCNDFDSEINSGASEVCDDGIDNDCNGLIDLEDEDSCQATIIDEDVNEDLIVNLEDLIWVAQYFSRGECDPLVEEDNYPFCLRSDVTGDGVVNIADMIRVAVRFGAVDQIKDLF